MIKYSNSNVFNADADCIVNTVNCEGFMGKGIALEFSLRYPKLLDDYKIKCEKKEIAIGKVDYFITDDKIIVNFPTKKFFKFPSQISWIEQGLKDFIGTYRKYNIKKIAFPPLGCGNGGLEFSKVKIIMEKYLSNLDIDVIICLDKNGAEGKEKEMLSYFNKYKIEELSNYFRLTSKQIQILKNNQNKLSRFYMIRNLKGIGINTYKNIFDYFYHNKEEKTKEQISLF